MKRFFGGMPFQKPVAPSGVTPDVKNLQDRWADGQTRPFDLPDKGGLKQVYSLNCLLCGRIGPLPYESQEFSPLFAQTMAGDVCFFDCDEPFHNCIDVCWQVLRTQSEYFRSKTLILHTRFGLRGAVKQIADLFDEVFCFYELWGTIDEYHEIVARFDAEHLFLLPVRANNRGRYRIRPHVNDPPAPRVFISLGSHTDRGLAREVVRNNPGIRFYAPDRTRVQPGQDGGGRGLAFQAPNLTVFESTGQAYARWFDHCDIVLIPVRPQVCMRGGIRMADAMYANKYIVSTPNAMCQSLMAVNGRTCLVAEDAAGVTRALFRIINQDFKADEVLYHRIRHLMLMPARLNHMLECFFSRIQKQRSAARINFNPRPQVITRAGIQ